MRGVGGSTVKLMQVETGRFSSVQGKTWYFMKANFAKFEQGSSDERYLRNPQHVICNLN